MAFNIKYDKDGQPSGNTKPIEEIEGLPEVPLSRFEQSGFASDQAPQQAQEVEEAQEESVNQESIAQVEVKEEPEVRYQANNFRTLRDEKLKTERERDEALARLRLYESQQLQLQQYQQQPAPQVQQQEELDINLEPDEIAEGKHVNQLAKQVQELKNIIKQQEQRSTVQTTEAKILSRHPDFHSVVNKENVDLLKMMDPELARTLDTSGDFYSAAITAYGAIKRMSIDKKAPDYSAEKALIQKNAAKPKPLASLSPQQGDSPLSRANAFANGLTPDLQKQLAREMADARRNM